MINVTMFRLYLYRIYDCIDLLLCLNHIYDMTYSEFTVCTVLRSTVHSVTVCLLSSGPSNCIPCKLWSPVTVCLNPVLYLHNSFVCNHKTIF